MNYGQLSLQMEMRQIRYLLSLCLVLAPQEGQAAMPWARHGMDLCPYYIPTWLSGFWEGMGEYKLTPSSQAQIGNAVEPLRRLAGTGWDWLGCGYALRQAQKDSLAL